jgi:hypothetical protein
LLVSQPAAAFTGTPAALALVREMQSAMQRVPAVRTQLTGAVVYCRSVPFEWTFAPMAGCPPVVSVSEDDNLRAGRVVSGAGLITVTARDEIRYVLSPAGFYARPAAASCWQLRLSSLQSRSFIGYPLPDERLAILTRTAHDIVLQALARNYRELDYVDPGTFLEWRQLDETLTARETYTAAYLIDPLTSAVPVPKPAQLCL